MWNMNVQTKWNYLVTGDRFFTRDQENMPETLNLEKSVFVASGTTSSLPHENLLPQMILYNSSTCSLISYIYIYDSPSIWSSSSIII